MPLPTRRHSAKSKKGVKYVHDTPYEAAYSAFRLALQEHCGEGVPCWVDDVDLDIDKHEGNKEGGSASGKARYKTTSADGQRIAPKTACSWSVVWALELDDGLPLTKLVSYELTEAPSAPAAD